MNRSKYFNYIEKKLNILATRINSRSKLNILDFNVHSENFYLNFFNKLYSWNLKNLNNISHNVEAIDLIDDSEKIVVQVSATSSKQKIESSLEKDIIKRHNDYTFKFISVSKNASDLRGKEYTNPHNITFTPVNDIYDIESILSYILSLEIGKQKRIYQFIKDELGGEVDIVKLDSNLAIIIDILSKEDWDIYDSPASINSFEIERKISFNYLDTAKNMIDDYKIHHTRIDKIYSEFDLSGKNKSSSVIGAIRKEYIKAKKTIHDDDLFFQILDRVQEMTIQSANYVEIPIDELELCIRILVVDAFIRCKIFENPEDYDYATT
jgi:hypothetical protein